MTTYIRLITDSLVRGDYMQTCCKDIALIALGATAVLAYQKYSKPLMDEAEKVMKSALKKADKKLDNMM